jgi:DNA polymerase IIIc chi subunit
MPFPDENKIMWHKSGYHSSGNEFYSDDFVEKVVSIIDFLEKNPQYKDIIRKRGKKYVQDNFNLEYIGSQWLKIV